MKINAQWAEAETYSAPLPTSRMPLNTAKLSILDICGIFGYVSKECNRFKLLFSPDLQCILLSKQFF